MDGAEATERDKAISARLRQRRKALGLSTLTVANHIGISRPAYYKWEDGKTRLTLDRLGRVASILRVSVQDLFHGASENGGTGAMESPSTAITEERRKTQPDDKMKRLAYVDDILRMLMHMTDDHKLLNHLLRMAELEARQLLAAGRTENMAL